MSRETFQSLRMLLMEKLDLARELTDEEILEELKTEFPALETEIEELGTHIVELENEINDPEVLRDHLLLRDKCDELDDSRFHQQELYDEWEKLAEEQDRMDAESASCNPRCALHLVHRPGDPFSGRSGCKK